MMIYSCRFLKFSLFMSLWLIPPYQSLLSTMVLGFIGVFIGHFRRINNSLADIAVELFGVCYLAIPLSFMLAILYPFYHGSIAQDGRWWARVSSCLLQRSQMWVVILLENYWETPAGTPVKS